MRFSLTDSARWPWWLATGFIALLVGVWWQPWLDDTAAPAAGVAPTFASAPAPMVGDRMPEPGAGGAIAPVDATQSRPARRFTLEGTVMAGAGSFAMVRHTTDSQSLLLRVGDRVDGLVVTEIRSGSVVLSGPAGPVVIEVGTRTAAAPPAGAVRPARPVRPAAALPPPVLSVEHLPEAYRGPAPENEVLGH